MHCDLDASFPNYNPNPEDLKMLKDLGKHVLAHKADIGFAFDGDGDRVGVVDNNGHEIFADKIGLLIARNLATEVSNSKFVIDVKSTSLFSTDEILKKNNSEIIFWKTGHSYIKRKTSDINATAGFERSGHFFFNNPIGRGYDDGILSALEILKILDKNENPPTPAGVNRRVGYVADGNVEDVGPDIWGGGATSHRCGVTSSRIANNMHLLHEDKK